MFERVGSVVRTTVVVELGVELVLLGFVGSEVTGSLPDLVVWTVREGSAVPSEIDTTTDAESTLVLLPCDGSVPDLVVEGVVVVDEVVPSLAGVVFVEEP